MASTNTQDSTVPAWAAPDLTRLLTLHRQPGDYSSYTTSKVSLPAGSLFARITSATPATCAYSSVQTGPNSHIELNSDLLYINHSCRPSLEFDMARFEVRVSRDRDLKEGDLLSFFYPSTEWNMSQPFECECKEKECGGRIDGAGNMSESFLRGFWLNEHIERLLAERKGKVGNGKVNGNK